jgi:hypothetical protein
LRWCVGYQSIQGEGGDVGYRRNWISAVELASISTFDKVREDNAGGSSKSEW